MQKFWLLSEKEREEAISIGIREGMLEGIRKGMLEGRREGRRKRRREVLAKAINFRFPEATPAFIKKALKPFEDGDVSELVSIIMTTDALDEFKKRLKTSASFAR